jgi:predicted TPR repeat methyltransferase
MLFKQIAEELKEIEKPKILSYGCSTGEEVFSIKQLIPNAEITGVDINHWCLRKARKKNTFIGCYFLHLKNVTWRRHIYYDCIFATGVFQKSINRNAKLKISDDSFLFKDFDNKITELVELLKNEGLFVLDHTDYRFVDLPVYNQQFQIRLDNSLKRFRPNFDQSNKLASATSNLPRIFIKKI